MIRPAYRPNVRLMPKPAVPSVMDIIMQAEKAKATKP